MFVKDVPIDLTPLLSLIEENPWWPELTSAVEKGSDGFRVQMPEAAKPYVIAALYHHLKKPVLVVTAQPENAKRLYEQAGNWYGSGVVRLFPDPEALPYEKVSADSAVEIERLQVLAAKSGIESISTQEGELVIRRFEGMRFNVQKVEPFLRGLRLPARSWFFDALQLRLNPKKIGERWRGVLEETVGKIG